MYRLRFDTCRFICATPDKRRHSFSISHHLQNETYPIPISCDIVLYLAPSLVYRTCSWHFSLGCCLDDWQQLVRGGREGVGRRARHTRKFGREMENGRARDGRHVSSGAATPPPPYSHLILIRLCRMYFSVSITVEFLRFEALSSRQTSTSNLLPRLTSFTLDGNQGILFRFRWVHYIRFSLLFQ